MTDLIWGLVLGFTLGLSVAACVNVIFLYRQRRRHEEENDEAEEAEMAALEAAVADIRKWKTYALSLEATASKRELKPNQPLRPK